MEFTPMLPQALQPIVADDPIQAGRLLSTCHKLKKVMDHLATWNPGNVRKIPLFVLADESIEGSSSRVNFALTCAWLSFLASEYKAIVYFVTHDDHFLSSHPIEIMADHRMATAGAYGLQPGRKTADIHEATRVVHGSGLPGPLLALFDNYLKG